MIPDDQTQYWDQVAWEKTFGIPLVLDQFASLVTLDQRILDYGCGYGRICAELVENGYRNVIGVDPSGEMIKRARQEHPDLEFDVIGGSRLPYEDGSFDAVLLLAVLTCIPDDDAQRALISELTRVVRAGGILNITDYPLQTDERNVARYREFQSEFGVYGVFRVPDGAVVRHHDMNWITSLVSGLEMVDMSPLDVITMNGHQAKAFRYLGRKIR